MSTPANTVETFANQEYKWGFVSDIAADAIPAGLNEDVIRRVQERIEQSRRADGIDIAKAEPVELHAAWERMRIRER